MTDEKLDINLGNAFKILNTYLKEKHLDSYEHSIRVAKISKILAQKWNANVEDAVIAGLLHDIGKSLSKREMLNLCIQNELTLHDFEIFETLKPYMAKQVLSYFKKNLKTPLLKNFRLFHMPLLVM